MYIYVSRNENKAKFQLLACCHLTEGNGPMRSKRKILDKGT